MNALMSASLEALQKGRKALMALVIAKDFSSPRGPGAKMLVLEDRIEGSVGGGGVEGAIIEKAREMMAEGQREILIMTFDLTAEESNDLHVCGGRVTVALIPLDEERFGESFKEMLQAMKAGVSGLWLIASKGSDLESLFWTQGEEAPALSLWKTALPNIAETAPYTHEDQELIVDYIHVGDRVHLFGGGHVSHAVAKLLPDLHFACTVYDDRPEFIGPDRFPDAHSVAVEDFESLPALELNPRDYIVILTRGHAYDEDVLAWALTHAPGYIGMIGSKTKVQTIFDHLLSQGFSQNSINRVHAPIGLPIGGDSPAEIAISIVAELMQYRKEYKNT